MVKKRKLYKGAFWRAAVLTIVLFLIGVSLGVFIESLRSNSIREQYEDLEFQILDSKLRTSFYQIMEEDFCEVAVVDNLEFSDMIYEDGKRIEFYEKFDQFGDKLIEEKKKYSLLKTEFWLNSIILKDRCGSDYDIIVYFYKDDDSGGEEQKQKVQSRILGDIKEKYGAEVMLIPLPVDLGLSVIDAFVEIHDIDEVPAILINEEIKLEGLHSFEEIEKLI